MYKVIKDGAGWGVVDETGTLINEEPLTKEEARKIAREMNHLRHRDVYADENPLWETLGE